MAIAILPACGSETVTFAIDFPSERSFILTESVHVDVVDAPDCAAAITIVGGEPGRILRRASGTACAARAGEIVVSSLPHRELAVVVTAWNSAGSATEPLLRGCRMVTIGDAPPALLEVELDFTRRYFPYESTVVSSGGPGCPTAEERCAGSCTP